MLTTGGAPSGLLAALQGGQPGLAPDAAALTSAMASGAGLPSKTHGVITAEQGSPLPLNGKDLPALADDLAALLAGQLPAPDHGPMAGTPTAGEALMAEDQPPTDPAAVDPALVAVSLAVTVPASPPSLSAEATEVTHLAPVDESLTADSTIPSALNTSGAVVSSTDVSSGVVASPLTLATAPGETAPGVIAKATASPLSGSDQVAGMAAADDAADAADLALSDDAVDAVAITTDAVVSEQTTAGADKEAFGRLLATSRLADTIGGVQRSEAVPSAAEPARQPIGAIAYRMQGQEMVASTLVSQSFHAEGWGNEIGERVVWFTSKHIQNAEIELDPPELGPLQVRISTQNDQTTVSFTSHHPAVREVLDQNLPKLKEMFADQGLNLVQADVSERRGAPQDNANGSESGQGAAGDIAGEDEVAATDADIASATTVRRGLIDAFA